MRKLCIFVWNGLDSHGCTWLYFLSKLEHFIYLLVHQFFSSSTPVMALFLYLRSASLVTYLVLRTLLGNKHKWRWNIYPTWINLFAWTSYIWNWQQATSAKIWQWLWKTNLGPWKWLLRCNRNKMRIMHWHKKGLLENYTLKLKSICNVLPCTSKYA